VHQLDNKVFDINDARCNREVCTEICLFGEFFIFIFYFTKFSKVKIPSGAG
jgi:hypothetical protein